MPRRIRGGGGGGVDRRCSEKTSAASVRTRAVDGAVGEGILAAASLWARRSLTRRIDMRQSGSREGSQAKCESWRSQRAAVRPIVVLGLIVGSQGITLNRRSSTGYTEERADGAQARWRNGLSVHGRRGGSPGPQFAVSRRLRGGPRVSGRRTPAPHAAMSHQRMPDQVGTPRSRSCGSHVSGLYRRTAGLPRNGRKRHRQPS